MSDLLTANNGAIPINQLGRGRTLHNRVNRITTSQPVKPVVLVVPNTIVVEKVEDEIKDVSPEKEVVAEKVVDKEPENLVLIEDKPEPEVIVNELPKQKEEKPKAKKKRKYTRRKS
jgi:hypothetical protein